MAPSQPEAQSTSVPSLPVKHRELVPYIAAYAKTSISELLQPFNQHEAKLRELFAQEPEHPTLSDPHVNTIPVFDGHETEITVRARDLGAESPEEKERYLMPLKDEERKSTGAPAVVQSFKDFQTNFNLFSESSLVDLNWSNVIAAGSSVVTSLLPVPEKYGGSKKTLRQYYHEILAPASDVDLFLYGLTEDEAVEKIKQIEKSIKDSILYETTTIRTKNAITIASQYPTRHVQIVLRIYKSISEILTGFDVDCSCVAYDGKQVYVTPRALAAFVTQSNQIDLTRRSPSYESRLSKYSHRGFEVYWPLLDRTRIDPTIFERSFSGTVGLARLLVLEKLPKASDRDRYMDQRRSERGRPPLDRYRRYRHSIRGNIKDDYDDEVADWVEEDEVSNYHTFTIPYGQKFHARKIEKLLYTKDLLLNAEWNKPKDREVNLHRHPAFFGSVQDVIHDCCGYCPKPLTPEDEEVAEAESKVYISGNISFIKDDPGRQAIGSFNPITDDDWTEMAYVGNTARLCQAIVDCDLEHVQDWLAQEGSNPNRRDYTGRTPLHLAVISSTPEIVQCLIDHGARLVARLADGRTALHLAAARGSAHMVKSLLGKSEQNEEEEARKEELRKQPKAIAPKEDNNASSATGEDDDVEMVDIEEETSDDEVAMRSTTTGSFVDIKRGQDQPNNGNLIQEEDQDEPDIYDVNVVAWDAPCSPLHLAIVNGHVDVVQELVQNFGADVLLPIKLAVSTGGGTAMLTLVLALQLPAAKAQEMTQTLLKLGASSAQADMNQATALHYYAATGSDCLQVLFDYDAPAVKRALNHLAVGGSSYNCLAISPLMAAIEARNALGAIKLLTAGAAPSVDFDKFIKSYQTKFENKPYYGQDPEQHQKRFKKQLEQPVILAVEYERPAVVLELLRRGVDPNTLTRLAHQRVDNDYVSDQSAAGSLLDRVQAKITQLNNYLNLENNARASTVEQLQEDAYYLKGLVEGSYKHWFAKKELQWAKAHIKRQQKQNERIGKSTEEKQGEKEKREAANQLMAQYEVVLAELEKKGAKTFKELYPDAQEHPTGTTYQYNYKPAKEEPFTIKFSFQVPDLTETRKEAYLELFQAAWSGDLATIKKLTLAPWGPDADRVPLKIAIQDSKGFSPFHVAILRGHLPVAKAILEVAQAQYQPKKAQRMKYTMNEDDEYSDEDSEADGDSIHVYSALVDEQFTIDNIGEVSTQVKSDVTPVAMLNRSCPVWSLVGDKDSQNLPGSLLMYAINTDDANLAKYLLNLGVEFSTHPKDDNEFSSIYSVSYSDFTYAMELGRIQILAEIIKRTGAGIPLDDLVKKSGVEVAEKPKYYRGLSVHGKKRADWAAAGRGNRVPSQPTVKHPPLLEAAYSGSLESVEWFLSDAPMRYYSAFASTNKHDERLQNLAKASGGIDQSISKWLATREDLVIHCVILSNPSDTSVALINYLVRTFPSALEKKSQSGHTPLHVAFSLRRVAAAKALLAAGADPTTRDHRGNNFLHSLLSPLSNQGRIFANDKYLNEMLELLDPALLGTLTTQRSADGPGSATPLARWMKSITNDSWYSSTQRYQSSVVDEDKHAAVLRIILAFSANGEELALIDGAGDTPLHTAVRIKAPRLLDLMLEKRPDLLYRENATGRTPAEMARDAWVHQVVWNAPKLKGLDSCSMYRSSVQGLVDRRPETFVEEKDERSGERKVWDVCQNWMEKDNAGSRKRKLVSLFEANEVAKRVAGQQGVRGRYGSRAIFGMEAHQDQKNDEKEDEDKRDEVTAWYATAAQWEDNPSYVAPSPW